jgi:hypothetical protein
MAEKAHSGFRALLQMLRWTTVLETKNLVTTEACMPKYCYRCSTCNKNWPKLKIYHDCVVCGTLCWSKQIVSTDHILSPAEIETLKAREAVEKATLKTLENFEKFCGERDAAATQADIARLNSEAPLYAEDFTKP